MKVALILLLFSLAASAQDITTQFKEAESHAPKGYPTLFLVTTSTITPATLGGAQECGMTIDTLGKRLLIVGEAGWTACKAYQPGTHLWGHVHQMVDQVVDLLDPTEPRPKGHRYFVRDVTLIDPATQR